MSRLVVKIAGESGQGLNSLGEMLLKILKESNYFVFGYREYPSLIRGGFASYQIDFGPNSVNSSSKYYHISICLSRRAIKEVVAYMHEGGILIHSIPRVETDKELIEIIDKKQIQIQYVDTRTIIKELKTTLVMENSILIGLLTKFLGLDLVLIKKIYKERFKSKPKEIVEKNFECLDYGRNIESSCELKETWKDIISLHPKENQSDNMLITGNHALALGSLSAGMRAYYSYPMTPASSILTYLASTYKEHKGIVKQAEDEISAAQMTLGSMYAGARALTGTSGGGFDLMTETLSLAGITETPFVCIIAQRPGPATGLPTWTGQGDLDLALYAGHGEYARCVVAVSGIESAYVKIQEAFNIAEKFQLPVLVLTEKQIAESIFSITKLPNSISIERHLVEGKELNDIKPDDRYKITENGVSPRWIPGSSIHVHKTNGDEHFANGRLTEQSDEVNLMIEKRNKKVEFLRKELPEPEYYGPEKPEKLLVGWGSTKGSVLDALNSETTNSRVGYLHYEYLFPVRLEKLNTIGKIAKSVHVVEQNYTSQFGRLLKTQDLEFGLGEPILKYDGRPFFVEELLDFLS